MVQVVYGLLTGWEASLVAIVLLILACWTYWTRRALGAALVVACGAVPIGMLSMTGIPISPNNAALAAMSAKGWLPTWRLGFITPGDAPPQEYVGAYGGMAKFSANPSNGETLTINGTTIRFVTKSPLKDQVRIGDTLLKTLSNLAVMLTSYPIGGVGTYVDGATLKMIALIPGSAPAMTKSAAAITLSGATFALGGSPCTQSSGAGDGGWQVQGADGCFLAVVPTEGMDVREFGAEFTGSNSEGFDSTSAIQAAINASCTQGGTLLQPFPIRLTNGYYRVAGGLTVPCSSVTIAGTNSFISTIWCASATVTCLATSPVGGPDSANQIGGFYLKDLSLQGVGNKTAGTVLDLVGATDATVENVAFLNVWNGIYVTHANDVVLRDVKVTAQAGHGSRFLLEYYNDISSACGGACRSDGLHLVNVTLQANWSGADCFDWDGFANTVDYWAFYLEQCNYGMKVTNSPGGGAGEQPNGFLGTDIQVDGASAMAVDITAGNIFHFDGDISNRTGPHGTTDTDAFDCSSAYDIVFGNVRVGNAQRAAFNNISCTGVQADGDTKFVWGNASGGSYPIVHLHGGSDTTISGSHIGADLGTGYPAPEGLLVDRGATGVATGVDYTNPGSRVAFINNGSPNFTIDGGRDQSGRTFVGSGSR